MRSTNFEWTKQLTKLGWDKILLDKFNFQPCFERSFGIRKAEKMVITGKLYSIDCIICAAGMNGGINWGFLTVDDRIKEERRGLFSGLHIFGRRLPLCPGKGP